MIDNRKYTVAVLAVLSRAPKGLDQKRITGRKPTCLPKNAAMDDGGIYMPDETSSILLKNTYNTMERERRH